MPTRPVQRPAGAHLVLLLILCAALAACGGRQKDPVGGESILLGDGPSLMGELEERAEGFLLDMAFVIDTNIDEPDKAVERFGALLAVNGAAMRDNASALEARFATLEGAERRLYEAQLAAFLGEANSAWRHAVNTFHARYPERGNQILEMVSRFDR